LLAKIFGSGLAFPLRTNDGMILPEFGKPNPRADSFSLYSNYVANTLLTTILPKLRLETKQQIIGRPQKAKPVDGKASPNTTVKRLPTAKQV
jgi:hypothetical protein